jgi:6-pyruvoyltetrahydropterin/6-carboxytetrahydropterin synthase
MKPERVLTTIKDGFSAAHRYWVRDWSAEQNEAVFGKCSRPSGHGHNYEVDATMDLRDSLNPDAAAATLHQVLELLDHKHLNLDTPYFADRQPTTENISALLYTLLQESLSDHAELYQVRVAESDDLWAVSDGTQELRLGRSASFSASHRLWTPTLSDRENARIFGKCANGNGHGHNYTLEVEVAGRPEPRQDRGFVIPLSILDAAIGDLINDWDHARLDTDTTDFRTLNPTGENIAAVAYRRLERALAPQSIAYLRLWETRHIFFEVIPEDRFPSAQR